MCNDEMACPLHDAWKRISNEYLGSLKNTTLQDVADFRTKAEAVEGNGKMGLRNRKKKTRKTIATADLDE
jgi:DNA-binding IscR family transcriptional regulator